MNAMALVGFPGSTRALACRDSRPRGPLETIREAKNQRATAPVLVRLLNGDVEKNTRGRVCSPFAIGLLRCLVLCAGLLLCSTASAAELDMREREVTAAAEALKKQPASTDAWRSAHALWLRARVALLTELYKTGEIERSLAELEAVEKAVVPGEDAVCRVVILEARVIALMRSADGWERARALLDQAERIASVKAETDLPLVVLLARVVAANSGQQYDESLATLKRLRDSPALNAIDSARARLYRVQASMYEAVTYHYMGQIEAARDAGVAGLTELAKGESTPESQLLEARLRANLAASCLRLDDQAEALRHAEAAITPLLKHSDDRACAEALASTYLTRAAIRSTHSPQGVGSKAVQSDFAEAQRLYEQCYGPHSASLLPMLTTQGWACLNLGDLDAANAALERGLRLAESNHLLPYFRIPLLENLCRLRLKQRRPDDARAVAVTMRDIWHDQLPNIIAAGSELDRLSMLRECAWVDSAMASRSEPPTEAETIHAIESIAGTYGVVLDSLMRDSALATRLPRDQRLRYTESRQQLALLTLRTPVNVRAGLADDVARLHRTLRNLEGSHHVDALSDGLVQRLQAALPADSALVIFCSYRTMDGRAAGRIAAAIVKSQSLQVLTIPVSRETILSLGDQLAEALARHRDAEVTLCLNDLRTALWQPLQPALGHVQQLYLCLDASMQRVPVTIWDHPRVTFLTTAQALLRKPPSHLPLDKGASWLLINAGTRPLSFKAGLPFPYSVVNQFKDHTLPALPGAAAEVAALVRDRPDLWAVLLSDTASGEPEENPFIASLVDSPAVIHFAGHATKHEPGIGATGPASPWWNQIDQPQEPWCSSLLFPNPQPATKADDIGNDNFLFAAELAGLDLSSTQLVTLSACQTGAGISTKNEGSYSLARAFHTAGVRDVISCTEVMPDAPAVKLMLPFYRRLEKGDDAAQAFWEEQHKLIKNDDPASLRAFGFLRLTRAWITPAE